MKKISLSVFIFTALLIGCAAANEARMVIPYQFQEARPFSDGLAAVKKGGLWGYIDRHAEWVIEPKFPYPDVGDFSFGMAFVRDSFINSSGASAFGATALKFRDARPFRPCGETDKSPLAAVRPGLWGYIGLDGTIKIEPKYDDAGDFSPAGLAPVKSGGLWGYINSRGVEVIPPRFDYAWSFSGEFAAVMMGGKVGYIDRNGGYTIKPTFDSAGPFNNGRALFTKNGYFGFINDKGGTVISTKYHGGDSFNDGLAPVATSSRWGYIDVNGIMRLPALYDRAQRFSEGLAAVEQDGLWGYISNN